ncbi:hypothetical protein [Longispora albida]|uniref:hypothetical protein n=1 Tax=Longispora albida TaxID=203523 RepID=UPI00035D39B4|nr:hypothetical protein [Longispora albida]
MSDEDETRILPVIRDSDAGDGAVPEPRRIRRWRRGRAAGAEAEPGPVEDGEDADLEEGAGDGGPEDEDGDLRDQPLDGDDLGSSGADGGRSGPGPRSWGDAGETTVLPVVTGDAEEEAYEDEDEDEEAERSGRFRLPVLGRALEVWALSALGVLVVALGYDAGRTGKSWAELAYWGGQALVFLPVAARMLSRRVTRGAEPFLLVMGLAVNQYLLKWMYSPDQFRFPDELQHLLGTELVVQKGRLFEANAALPVGAYFPGLEEMGAATASLTGLTVTQAGFVLIAVTRLMFVAGLFAMVRAAGGSPVVAGLSCVVYTTALHYLFFNAMYLYQAAALPFLIFALWSALSWYRKTGARAGVIVTGVLSILVVTVTHHVTGVALAGLLFLLAACGWIWRKAGYRSGATILLVVAAGAVALWFAFPARAVLPYFEAPAKRLGKALGALFSGSQGTAAHGTPAPAWESAVQALGMLALLAVFGWAVYVVVKEKIRHPLAWALLLGSLAFFGAGAMRFAGSQGPELAGRASTFTYLPLSIVVALVLLERRRASHSAQPRRVPVIAGTVLAALLLVTARVGGWPPAWDRLPGPHKVGAFERSVDRQGLVTAKWARGWLGAGHRMAGDTTGNILAAAYGRQKPVGEASALFYPKQWGILPAQRLKALSVDFLWVDIRLSAQLPASGTYFNVDPMAGQHVSPILRESLAKFNALPKIDRVYDSGVIRIYDVRDL